MKTLWIPGRGERVHHVPSGIIFTVTDRTRNEVGQVRLVGPELDHPALLEDCEPAPAEQAAPAPKPVQRAEKPKPQSLKGWQPQINDWVCKRYFEGWLGNVIQLNDFDDSAEVMWTADNHASTVAISELRPQFHPVQQRRKH